MYPKIPNVDFSENEDRLKIILPVKRNWFMFVLFSLLMAISIYMLLRGTSFAWEIGKSGERFAFAFTSMLIFLLLILYWFMRHLWRLWQFYTANREILFINEATLIVRRPLSIFGITDAYDMRQVKPLFYEPKHNGAGFYYGSQPILIGLNLGEAILNELIEYVNGRFFPNYDDYDEDE